MTLTKLTQADVDSASVLATARATIATDEAYLASTDWYAVRYAEAGTEIPDEIKAKRAAARTEISELREKYGITE